MLNFTQVLKNWQIKKKKQKLLKKPLVSILRFKKQYPNYTIGTNCYGVPLIKHAHPETTLKIGSYCSFAKNVQIFLGGNHRTDWITTYRFPIFHSEAEHIKNSATSKGSVIIGNDVWLCENSTILSGVTIGDGAVIANGAIVTTNVAPYSIVGGNPAKHIRWRFNEITRQALIDAAWWDWSQEEVLKIVDLLCSDDISTFISYVKSRNQQ
ncbi:MAG: CatB-related O-acetyltransferase [Methylophilus sp.]